MKKRNSNPSVASRVLPDTGMLDGPLPCVLNSPSFSRKRWLATAGLLACSLVLLPSCSKVRAKSDSEAVVTVGVVKVGRKNLQRQITLSSELVPFQEIDVYAKEAGYVQKLYVDYGSRVKEGQLMAVLEIPELEEQLKEDQASVKIASDEVTRAEHMLQRDKTIYKVLDLEYTRLHGVIETQPGLVAQQEVDDAEGKALAAASQVDAAESALAAAQAKLLESQSRLAHDQALFAYSRITAPFAGVVTQRYANLGTLMQTGTGSSTQVLPLVRLSEDNLFRLVIPVPESFVRYIHLGQTVSVAVPSLGKTFPGKVARFSVEVAEDTRTMHTEVDVENPDRILLPGLYAEATVVLEKAEDTPFVPLQAVDHDGNQTMVEVVSPAGQIESRHVRLGMQTATDAAIVSGLNPGEMVVVTDRSGLKPGQHVNSKVVELLQYQGEEEN